MAFVKTENGKAVHYPYSIGQLRRDNPNVSFPKAIPEDTLVDYGVFPASVDPAPSHNTATQSVVENSLPDLRDGAWVIGWSVVDLSGEALTKRLKEVEVEARALRDSLLAATDWTANSDVTMSDEMRTYRQALRDVPAQAGFPDNVTWPTAP